MQSVYRILDNIFKKASCSDELKDDKTLLNKIQLFLNILNSKLFKNIIDGQGLLIENENYNTQMNKVSSLNIPDISVDYNSSERKLRKKSKIRR